MKQYFISKYILLPLLFLKYSDTSPEQVLDWHWQ